MKIQILFAFVFISITNGIAQNKGLLYELSGNGLTQKSYLFGTIHMQCQKDFAMPDSVKNCLNRCSQLTLEVDLDQPGLQLKALKGMKMKGDSSLKDLYSSDDYNYLKTYLKDTLKLPFGMLDKMKPLLFSALILPMQMQCKLAMFEKEFEQLAKKQKKEILGLETIEYQLSMLDKIPYKVQGKDLLAAIKNPSQTKKDFEKLVSDYKKEDLDLMDADMKNGDEMFLKYENDLITQRNINWVPIITKMAQEKSTFFAVGAGHLIGLIDLLKKSGIQVKVVD